MPGRHWYVYTILNRIVYRVHRNAADTDGALWPLRNTTRTHDTDMRWQGAGARDQGGGSRRTAGRSARPCAVRATHRAARSDVPGRRPGSARAPFVRRSRSVLPPVPLSRRMRVAAQPDPPARNEEAIGSAPAVPMWPDGAVMRLAVLLVSPWAALRKRPRLQLHVLVSGTSSLKCGRDIFILSRIESTRRIDQCTTRPRQRGALP